MSNGQHDTDIALLKQWRAWMETWKQEFTDSTNKRFDELDMKLDRIADGQLTWPKVLTLSMSIVGTVIAFAAVAG